MNNNKLLLVVVILMAIHIPKNVYAGFFPVQLDGTELYVDNAKYQSEYSNNQNVIIGNIVDVTLLKFSNDQANDISNALDKNNKGIKGLQDLPTFFALDYKKNQRRGQGLK